MALPQVVVKSTGTSAVALSAPGTADKRRFRVGHVILKFNTAPSTSENITITRDDGDDASYDVNYLTTDPSVGSKTSVVWYPSNTLELEDGDQLVVSYTNTDGRTIGAKIVGWSV